MQFLASFNDCFTVNGVLLMFVVCCLPHLESRIHERRNINNAIESYYGYRVQDKDCLEPSLEERVRNAAVILTGTIRDLEPSWIPGRPRKAMVEIKRIMKGSDALSNEENSNLISTDLLRRGKTVIVDGINDEKICNSDARKLDTWIYLLGVDQKGLLRLNSSLLYLNLDNIDTVESLVKGWPQTTTPTHAPEVPCEVNTCKYNARCMRDTRTWLVRCKCLEVCDYRFAPVCGSNGVTYTNECHLRLASCMEQTNISIINRGRCGVKDPCQAKNCSFGAYCVASHDGTTARCQCPERCNSFGDSVGSKPICGTDGKDYANVCEMRKASCFAMTDIQKKYAGKCDPCQDVICPSTLVCQLDEKRNPVCRCNGACSMDIRPVCGSDGKTYVNECVLRLEACRQRKTIKVFFWDECSRGNNPCSRLACKPAEECEVDEYSIARCVCPSSCEPIVRTVCGSDGQTYDNECEMRRHSCVNGLNVIVSYNGACHQEGLCSLHSCHHGSVCVVVDNRAECRCSSCTDEYKPVCGNDGVTYRSDCALQEENCEKIKNVAVRHQGTCNACENKECKFYSVCENDEQTGGRCVCPSTCIQVRNEVCGSNGITYTNECELMVASCHRQQHIDIAFVGSCDGCSRKQCKFGAVCQGGECVCPQNCVDDNSNPVCASDGMSYRSECRMRISGCEKQTEVKVIHHGVCEEGSGTSGDVCDETTCQFGGRCEYNEWHFLTCSCNFNCYAVRSPVCGSDGKTYGSECQMKQESCLKQKPITQQPMENCEDIDEELCDGRPPMTDPTTGRPYKCDHSERECPANSYCHRTLTESACCSEDVMVKDCHVSMYGCCADDVTSATGPDKAGCSDVCQCNPLGSLRSHCDPVTRQCTCKPGVGGLTCDRCEISYWGMPKIATGNIGCTPCSCNLFGSVRDDCDQMTGRCVCRPGITGQKCNVCSNGKELGPNGCAGIHIIKPGHSPSQSCLDIQCHHGAVCQMYNGIPECICPSDCQTYDPQPSVVCGTDGLTYGSSCQLKLSSCRLRQNVQVAHYGPCVETSAAAATTPTYKPVRVVKDIGELPLESAISNTDPGVIGGFCLSDIDCIVISSYCKNGMCSCQSGLLPSNNRKTCIGDDLAMPSFARNSFMRLRAPKYITRDSSIEIEFRPMRRDGLLFYIGQTTRGSGDYMSLALVNGHAELRYDLGSGPAVLRTDDVVSLDSFQRVVARRHGQDAVLSLNDGKEVNGKSPGNLRSLNIGHSFYIGFIENKTDMVFKNIGTREGFYGCMMSLRIDSIMESVIYDLMERNTPDIEKTENIGDCGKSPCVSDPCQHGGSCVDVAGGLEFQCQCQTNFTGMYCQQEQPSMIDPYSACEPNPCVGGGSCYILPGSGFVCACPEERHGERCEKGRSYGDRSVKFDGSVYYRYKNAIHHQNVNQVYNRYEFRFRTERSEGLLLVTHRGPTVESDYLVIAISQGRVEVSFNLGQEKATNLLIITSSRFVHDGSWHHVSLVRDKRHAWLSIDGETPMANHAAPGANQLDTDGYVYLGGATIPPKGLPNTYYTRFHGCIEQVKFDDQQLNLVIDRENLNAVSFCET